MMADHEIDLLISRLMAPVTKVMTRRVKQIMKECAITLQTEYEPVMEQPISEADCYTAKSLLQKNRRLEIDNKYLRDDLKRVREEGYKLGMEKASEIAETVIDSIEFDEHGDRGASDKVVAAIQAEIEKGCM